jgi:predicted nucleotidyltransferase
MSAGATMPKSPSASQVDVIVRRIVQEFAPSAIYLFGSYAYGQPDADSDLDVLVVVPTDPPPVTEFSQRGYTALRDLNTPVELHFWGERTFTRWATVPASLPHVVKSRGRLLYAA